MQGQYNMRSPAVKRLMKEAQELNEPTELYHAQPLEDNLFEWHFTLRGPEDSEFESGIYHGRIILPPDYPMKPPSIILLTPNGRFETFKKICLSISGHHPESWQPSWSIRTALLALIGFMPTHGGGAIGSLDYTPEERKVLAKKSQDWKCPDCGVVTDKLKPVTQESEKVSQEAKALASQINFQGEKKGASESNSEGQSAAASSSPATPAAASSTPAPTSPPPASPLSPFPFPWAMPPGWNPSTAGASGGMAFPRFPYPPPFMMPAPGLGSAGRPGGQQQMPMFPPPLPFFPSMFPGFPPITGQPGAAVASSNATTVSSSQANNVGGGVMPSVASTPVTAAATTAAPPAVTTATPFASQPLSAPSTSNTTATETVGTSSVRPTTASTPQTSVAGPIPAATSTTGISSPQPAATTSPTATSTTTGLRQRQTATSRPATTSAAQTTSPRSQTSQRVSLVLMLVVAFIIGLLLARRVYMQFYGPHYRGVMD